MSELSVSNKNNDNLTPGNEQTNRTAPAADIRNLKPLDYMAAGDRIAIDHYSGILSGTKVDIELSGNNTIWYLIPGRRQWTLLNEDKQKAVKRIYFVPEQAGTGKYFIMFDNGELCPAIVYQGRSSAKSGKISKTQKTRADPTSIDTTKKLKDYIISEFIQPYGQEAGNKAQNLERLINDEEALRKILRLMNKCPGKIFLDEIFARELYKEGKIEDIAYLATLERLGRSGIIISGNLIRQIAISEAKNTDYINKICELSANGIQDIDALFLRELPSRAALDRGFIDELIYYKNKIGLRIDFDLLECLYDTRNGPASEVKEFIKENVAFLRSLSVNGNRLNSSFLFWIFLINTNMSSATDRNQLLINLSRSGIEITERFLLLNDENNLAFIDDAYLSTVESLARAGIKFDEFLLGGSNKGSPSREDIFMDISGVTEYFGAVAPLKIAFPPEKANNPHYGSTLKELAASGVKVNGAFITAFTIPMCNNPEFVAKLYQLGRDGRDLDIKVLYSDYENLPAPNPEPEQQAYGYSGSTAVIGNKQYKHLRYYETGRGSWLKVTLLNDDQKKHLKLDETRYGTVFYVDEGPRIKDLYRFDRTTSRYEYFGKWEE